MDLLLNYSTFDRIGMWVNSVNSVYRFLKLKLLYKSSLENFSKGNLRLYAEKVQKLLWSQGLMMVK